MTNKIPNRELEAISAYLDNELPANTRQRFEMDLEHNPDLRTALEEIRRTRAVLRSAPKLRAPRNFMLTPEMAGLRSKQRSSMNPYGMLRLASSLAVIFLVIAVVGEFFASTRQPTVIPVAQEISPAPFFAPGLGGGGGGGGGNDVPAEELALPKEAPVVEGETETRADEPVMDQAMPADEAEALVLAPTSTETPLPTPTPLPPPEPQAPSERAVLPGWSLFRLLQISLALIAILAGAAAFIYRRSGGH
jgi:hypothetical protein